jgi:hypothetical protein
MEPQRVVIGSDAENPLMLTACEWLDVFVDQRRQIRRSEAKNGVWHLLVDQPGTYTFELRRWPREANVPLRAGLSPTTVTDGSYVAGKALPIAGARIRIGTFTDKAAAERSASAFTFRTQLAAGPIELQTWMLDDAGDELCGAYDVYV